MVSTKIKSKTYTTTKVKNNILRVWNTTTDKDRHDWYRTANRFAQKVSEIYHVDNSRVIGILSALSPLTTWERNKQMVHDFLVYGTVGAFAMNVNKCKDIMECDGTDKAILKILNGEKTKNFYLNIKYPNCADHLTVDRHAIRIALNIKRNSFSISSDELGLSKPQYNFIKEAYIKAANKVGVKPLLMQSATWVKIRD